MMFAFVVLCVSFLISIVHATPLINRDVFSPHITNPNEDTVWPVGTKQMVTWETKDIPPDSQLTNPNGKVVLGHLGDDGGLNLQLDNPLAQNFKLRIGKVEITVPDVPAREDYIVVLFGDSGNASPAFAITRIRNGSNSTTTAKPTKSNSATSASPTSSSTLITEPIPITGTTITGGESTPSTPNQPTSTPTSPVPSQPDTTPSQSAQSGQTTQSSQTTGVSAPASTTSSNSAIRRIGSTLVVPSIGVVSFLLMLAL